MSNSKISARQPLDFVWDCGGRTKLHRFSPKLSVISNDRDRVTEYLTNHKEHSVGDCVVRSVAIASGLPYNFIYDKMLEQNFHVMEKKGMCASEIKLDKPDTGLHWKVYEPVMNRLGFKWTPTMGIGTGCRVHLCKGEIPMDKRLVIRCSGHLTSVVNGVIHDTYNPSRQQSRCVYGFWSYEPELEVRG